MNTAYILTGGNLGNRQQNLQKALLLLSEQAGRIISISSLYETAAWGNKDQPSFLNQAIALETHLPADVLLVTILSIEQEMGRRRFEKMGPRTIDIDILFYNNLVIESNQLVIPHPQLHKRKFVLLPLNEIAGSYIHPVFNKTVSSLLHECDDPLTVEKFKVLLP